MDIETVARQLGAVSDTPRPDARRLIKAAGDDEARLQEFVARRLRGEPVSKIIGLRGFWKRDFVVTKDVLDPRPDSETLIEAVLRFYPEKTIPLRFLDIGTGSGCLLTSLLDEYAHATGIGVDISPAALAVAACNTKPFGKRIQLRTGDFTASNFGQDWGVFDVIVSNPPYIKTNDIDLLAPDVRLYDPRVALDGGSDGLSAYRTLAACVGNLLAPGGRVFFEIGQGQGDQVVSLMEAHGFSVISRDRDLSGIERVLVFGKSTPGAVVSG